MFVPSGAAQSDKAKEPKINYAFLLSSDFDASRGPSHGHGSLHQRPSHPRLSCFERNTGRLHARALDEHVPETLVREADVW